ncbi:hypothetical protein IAE29_16405 [Ochrobactrum sp. S46]|nr:hypothetical protein [Ochrobactrum sp. S45]MBK0044923.1 hypothetical protein [Ochrobactrum sp. S46]
MLVPTGPTGIEREVDHRSKKDACRQRELLSKLLCANRQDLILITVHF